MLVGSMHDRDNAVQSGLIDLYVDLDLRGVSLLAFDEVSAVADRGYELAAPRITEWAQEQTS